MYPAYRDIFDRIPDPPLWWDHNGCPRFDLFDPSEVSIYWDVAVLFEIACQSCDERFLIGQAWSTIDRMVVGLDDGNEVPLLYSAGQARDRNTRLLSVEEIVEGHLSFGDAPRPPDHSDCAGTTMSTDVTRVVQVWERGPHREAVRRTDLECDEVDDEEVGAELGGLECANCQGSDWWRPGVTVRRNELNLAFCSRRCEDTWTDRSNQRGRRTG